MKSKKISILVASAAIASFAISFTPGITSFADPVQHIVQNGPIEMMAKPTVNSDYSNVQYDYTMAKYAAAEMKEFIAGHGANTKANLDAMLKAINPQYADSAFEFLRVDTFRNVNEAKVSNLLNGKGVLSGQADNFIAAAKKYNLDPVYFISQSILETGWGTSQFANGTTIDQIAVPVKENGKTVNKIEKLSKPVTVYNLFGIGADNGNPTLMATTYAYNHGWTSISKAIDGAAKFLSENYVHNTNIAQNTPYELRFIDAPSGDMWHQYSTDIQYASQIGTLINQNKDLYDSNDTFEFNIPKFEGSVSKPDTKPTTSAKPDIKPTNTTKPEVKPTNKVEHSKVTSNSESNHKITSSKDTTSNKTKPVKEAPSKKVSTTSNTSSNSIATSTSGNTTQYTDAMSNPTWYSNVVTTIPAWSSIKVIGYANADWQGWVKAIYNGQTVWIPAARVTTNPQTKYPTISTGVINFNGGSDILTDSTWNSNFLTYMSDGTSVSITGESNGWYRINYLDMSGWVPMSRVDNSNAYKVIPINKQGIIEMPNGPYTDAKDIPSWYGYVTAKLFNGTHVGIIGSYNGWDKLSVDNQILWVPSNRVQSNGLNTPIGYGTAEFPSIGYTDIMSGPTWYSSFAGTLQDGTFFNILAQKDGWYQIETFQSSSSLPMVGWIPVSRTVTSLNKAYISTGITSMYSDVMHGPTWDSSCLGTLPSNTYVNIISIENGWCQIAYNGGTGWMPLPRVGLLKLLNKPTKETGIISFSQNPFTDAMYEPTWYSNFAGTLNNGATVQIVGQKDGWTEINYQSTTAWIPSNRIQTGAIKQINFNLGYTDITTAPTWYSSVKTTLNNNTNVVVLSKENGWSKIAFDGTTGWVPSNRLS